MTKKRILLLLTVIVVGICGYLYDQYYKKPVDTRSEEALFRVTAPELVAAFKTNEQAAQQKYTDKILSVTGKLITIQTDSSGQVTAFLQGNDPMAAVTCSFYKEEAGKLKALSAGQVVRIKGICTGILTDVILNKCSLEEL